MVQGSKTGIYNICSSGSTEWIKDALALREGQVSDLQLSKTQSYSNDGHITVRNRHGGGLEFDFTLSK